jgi:hypothetical protein
VRLDGTEFVPQGIVGRIVLERGFHVVDRFFVFPGDHTQHSKNDERFWLVRNNLGSACEHTT